jgi:menaquinone-dependent protoporphyrinogen IX oxidase
MKAIIIYKSKYGATKQYADWLSEETGFPAISSDKFNETRLREFDTIIIGTSVYIGKLLISGWLKNNWYVLENKKLHLFVVAGTLPTEKEKLTACVKSSVPKELFNELSLTFLHGKLILNELGWFDRFMLKMGKKAMEKKNPSEKIPVDYNDVRKENLDPLIAQLKESAPSLRELHPIQ